MRLLSARIRDYRIHRDLAVEFDPRFTVIAGPNQSGKSTLAEALHRALFLPFKTGGELQKGMQTSPFLSDPEVELSFEAGSQRWTLRKRFAATRGSASLTDGRGVSLQGEEAEERLAQLVGTAAVARNRGAADQLRERWGHLWVWQGSASSNPLTAGQVSYDHDRLVERLQAGTDLGVTSSLDLAVLEDIQGRWDSVYTPGGANRAPKVRTGSALQLARAASEQAQEEWHAIEASIAQQADDAQTYQQALDSLSGIGEQLPEQRQQLQGLQQHLVRSRELQDLIGNHEPLLDAAVKELTSLGQDRSQLSGQQQRIAELTADQAPGQARLDNLKEQLPVHESGLTQAQQQLEQQQTRSDQAIALARSLEQRLNRTRLQREQLQLNEQLAVLEALQDRLSRLDAVLAALPEVDGATVERLRKLDAAVRDAQIRAESLSAGIEVIRAGQLIRLDGQPLDQGCTQLLSQPAVLQVGDDVELRLLPGGGNDTAQAAAAVDTAQQALTNALAALKLPSLEEAATAERQRGDLQAERQGLLAQIRSAGDATKLKTRQSAVATQLAELPAEAGEPDADGTDSDSDASTGGATATAPTEELSIEAFDSRIAQLELTLQQAREQRDAASTALKQQQTLQQQAGRKLEQHRKEITDAEQALRQQENQLLEANTLRDALLQRHGSLEALQDRITAGEQRRQELQITLDGLRSELNALDPERLSADQLRLTRQIEELEQQEREANEARIRAEERLHSDGSTDLQAELEQKQAELESRLQEQERLEKEAGMLTLLRQLLDEEQNAMGSQYTAPIVGRLGRYLAEVFPEAPEASLAYDARRGFQELHWRRGSESAFSFEVLSTGAREQFAACLRVSMAEVLAEAYDGCLPVLFDDAFANSDPERQAGVYRMLMQAADQGLQVLVLSCDPERSQAITGARRVVLGR
jgi:energy-coupling factor transporter ATP-binding protein EcfA2